MFTVARRLRHPAGDALAGLEADGGDGAALRDLRLELRAVVGDEVDRGALGVEQLGHLLEQHDEQAVEIERRAEHLAELADGGDLLLLDAELLLELGG